MSRCAVVQTSDNTVVNVIIADKTDPAPDGCVLVELTEDEFVEIGWIYNPATNTFSPPNFGI